MQISIVMPTLNQANFIDASLQSIFDQSVSDVEVIVIDGLSQDGTIDILKKWQVKHPEQFKWISQKDTGPAEAVNRGLQLAKGDIIGWLNSDDLYSKDAFFHVVDFFKKNKDKDVVYGEGNHIDEKGNVIDTYPSKKPDTSLDSFLEGSFICQPTLFLRRDVLSEVGLLDTSLKLAFDFDWWIRMFKAMPNAIGFIDKTLASSRLHEHCLTLKERRLVAFEGMKVLKRYFDQAPITWALTYVDELCEIYPFINDQKSLVQTIESFLTDIKSFVSVNDLKSLIQKLKQDQRLVLSNLYTYVDVSPDGWVSQKTSIKCREAALIPQDFMEIELRGGWPIQQNIGLTIDIGSQAPFKTKLESRSSVTLKFKIPKDKTQHEVVWSIKTDEYFVPKEHDEKNDDNRKLSFMVTSLKFVDA